MKLMVVLLLILEISIAFGSVPAKSVSYGDALVCVFRYATCYLVKKVGPNVGAPSKNIFL
eukprot:gene12277-5861_t